jgi:macrolide transport system ATP-binding/permease protein
METGRWWDVLRMRFRSLAKRQRVETELDKELRYHIERQTEENIADGMNAREAREAASHMFGGVSQIEEECRICAKHSISKTFCRTCGTRYARSARVQHLQW